VTIHRSFPSSRIDIYRRNEDPIPAEWPKLGRFPALMNPPLTDDAKCLGPEKAGLL